MRGLFAVVMLLGACSDSGGSGSGSDGGAAALDAGSGGGGGGATVTRCRYDDECPAGQACNDEGECSGGQACDQDFHCGTGERCLDASCRRPRPLCARCDDDSQCGEDAMNGLANPCVEHGGSRVCAMEASARECPAGLVRSQDGYCLPEQCGSPIGCAGDEDCPIGTRCAQRDGEPGLCLDYCREDSDCEGRATCEPITGQCLPPCEPGSCPSNQSCHDDGRCGPGCGGDGDCADGFTCREGRCRLPGCSSDADCPPRFGIYCDTESRECVEGCRSDEHCSATQICREGQCAPRPCRTKELDCGLGQFCCANGLDDGGSPCPDGVEAGACFDMPDGYCAECSENEDCTPPSRHGTDSLCIEYQDRDGNALGKACTLGCRDVGDCPRGFNCSELTDDQGNPQGSICTAAMCVTGELPRR